MYKTCKLSKFFTNSFLDAFAKLRKTTISFAMPVRPSLYPSVRMEQLDSHWKDFYQYEISYLSIFENLSRKFKFL
jgi:hypothetical protein